jgi:transposase
VDDATSLLFDLPGFLVLECVELSDDVRQVLIMQSADEHGCPRCGVIAEFVFDEREQRVKDLPFGERRLVVVWRKRRYRCLEQACPQRVFVERSDEIRLRRRTTERLRRKLATADAECRAYARVAGEYEVSWWLVNDVAVRAAAQLPAEPAPVRWLGIDETRTRTPRWVHNSETGKWSLENPWMTSLTNLDTTVGGPVILGLTPGRSSVAVRTWLEARQQAWRDGIEVVAIDSCAAYAHAVRKVLPHAAIVLDHFHAAKLGNDMLTKVRRRVTWDNRDRRGRLVDPEWANRRRLLTAHERLTPQRFAKMWNAVLDGDPTGEILAAYIAKEELRRLLALAKRRPTRDQISNAKYRLGAWCAAHDHIPELVTLAKTIDAWWPEIEAFLRLDITNARTEGSNRTIKQLKRVGCGFANQVNYQRRILAYTTARKAA